MTVCSECGKPFHNKSNLNRHMRAAHAQVDQSDESDDGVDESDDDVDESDDDVDVESTVEKYELASDNEQLSGDEEEVDVWKVITDEADDEDGGVLQAFKRNVLFCRSFKRDETYQAVINTLEKVKEDEEMDFAEALDYAVDKRKFIIYRSAKEAEHVQQEEEGEVKEQ